MPDAPRLVAFYRADPWARMWRVLLRGPAALTAGSLVIALSLATHASRSLRDAASAVGFVLVAAGAIYTLLGMHRILREDSYVALRIDGLVVHSSAAETIISWDSLRAVRWEALRKQLVLERDDAPPVVAAGPFANVTGQALAELIAGTKRKIAMNLLR
jgi:hypothetical protein